MKIKSRRFSSLNTSQPHSLIKFSVNQHKNSQTQPDQNSIVKLSKILNTLQDDSFKRYNTNDDRYLSQQRYYNNQENQNSLQRTNAPLQQPQKQYQISPQPWYNQMQPIKSDQLRKLHNISKSSHISFSNNQPSCPVRQNLSKTHHPTSNQVNNQAFSQNFSYTNQQKAKYSLQYLIHEKKHRKIEKILKYRAHHKDRTVLKQQKIYQHSKFLIETLKKLSTSDYIQSENSHLDIPIGQSTNTFIQPAVKKDILHANLPNKTPLKHTKTLSCSKFQILKEGQKKQIQKTKVISFSFKNIQANFLSLNQNQKLSEKKPRTPLKVRKNFIFEQKPISLSQKCLKINQPQKPTLSQQRPQKPHQVINHFLKINKLKV